VDDGRHGVVAHGQQRQVEAERGCERPGGVGQGVALVDQARPGQVDRAVAVADEHELRDRREAPPARDVSTPGLPVCRQVPWPIVEAGLVRYPVEFVVSDRRIIGDTPPGLAVEYAATEKENGIEVGTDEVAAEFHVVAGVRNDRRLRRREDPVGTREQLGRAGSPGEEGDHTGPCRPMT